MNSFKIQMNSLLNKQLNSKEIVNIILCSIILIMPLIVTNTSGPKYVIGKVYYIYISTLLAMIISCWCGRFKIKKEYVVSIIFLMTIFISSLMSSYKDIAFWGSYDRSEGFVMMFAYIALFIISSEYFKLNKKILNVILIVSSLMSIYGVLQFYGIDPIQMWALGEIIVKESIGTIGHRNFLSTYLSIHLYLSIAIFIFRGIKRYLIYSLILFGGLLCTLTRGGWLAFVIYSFVGLIIIIRRKDFIKRALVILILFISIFFIINITSNGKLIDRADKSVIVSDDGNLHGSAGARVNILKLSWKAFKDSPILGQGPDTLKMRLSNDYPEDFIMHSLKYNEAIDKSHNEYLEYAVSGGIFTLIFYLMLLVMIFIGLIKNFKDDKFKIIILTLFGYLVQAFLNISVIMVAPLFWIFLGYCVQSIYEEREMSNEDILINTYNK